MYLAEVFTYLMGPFHFITLTFIQTTEFGSGVKPHCLLTHGVSVKGDHKLLLFFTTSNDFLSDAL